MFKLLFKKSAEKELRGISRPFINQVLGRVEKLTLDPRPAGYEKLKGDGRLYRIRQGDYRVIYEVYDPEKIIKIIKIGHRREIYSD